ncbi:MAG: 50S ribosomal protein L11 methyltransferase [Rhizobacter sp.]|nr:50S ribosomal protein L11 methyltransferase [Bacteriovorax sp.]
MTNNSNDALTPEEIAAGDVVMTQEVVPWHFPMMNDTVRNDAYEKALKTALKKGGSVLDIGSGSGLLAMMAARHGATAVTTCELVPVVAEKAKVIIQRNGFGDQINSINKLSTNMVVGVDLPERADILVTEIFDNGLLGEHAFIAIEHARQHLLKPDAQLIPAGARVYAMLIESTEIYKNHRVDTISNFDLSPFNQFTTFDYIGYHLDKVEYTSLTSTVKFYDFDFKKIPGDESTPVEFEITKSGTCHAVAYWYELQVDDDTIISTAPHLPQLSCWKQAVQLFPKPFTLTKGNHVMLMAHHDHEAIWFTGMKS